MRTVLAGMLFCVAAPAVAQPAGSIAKDAAMTPVEDVNLKRREIPAVLIAAQEDPYSADATRTCPQITAALSGLDAVLGPDFDAEQTAKKGLNKTGVAKSVVGSFIPFRGVIREVSGAAGAQRRYEAAVDAGVARRGYLRGIGKMRGCKPPVATPRVAAN